VGCRRIGVIREPLDPRADPASADYKQVRVVTDRALADLKRLGAAVVDPVTIPDVASRSVKLYDESGYLQRLLIKEALRQDVLKAMADRQLDALVYATFDHPPVRIPVDAMTRPPTPALRGESSDR
jgi:hypothetical protein